MPSATTQTRATPGHANSKRARGGRRVNNRVQPASVADVQQPQVATAPDTQIATATQTTNETVSEEFDVCWICAEKIKYYSIAECNHTTCHVCALRLRALYKRQDCTFCKHPQPTLVITSTPPEPFQTYDISSMRHFDEKLAMYFETNDMLEDCLILLRFNCPDADCDFVASGWADLKWHVRDRHDKLLCDLCIRHKKIFAHEHTTYTPRDYPIHMPSLRRNATWREKDKEKEKESDLDVHPMCDFCQECFYGDDDLYKHLRERHEECFVCKKEGIMHQYFLNWEKLDAHFKEKHYPCNHPLCLEQKFVVFPTQMDLQAHSVEVHGDAMSGRDRRDAQRLDMAFSVPSYAETRRAGNTQTMRARAGGTSSAQNPSESAQPPGVSSSAGPGLGGPRRAAFGSALTSATTETPNADSGSSTPAYRSDDVDPEHAKQYAVFMEHVQSVATTPNGPTAIRHAVRSFRQSESTVYDVLNTIFTVLDRDLDKTNSLVTRLLDTFEGEKRDELLEAWNGMKTEQRRQRPDGAGRGSGPSSGQSDWAGVASGRVLNVKHSIASGGKKKGSPRSIWDRVERAATSSSPGAAPSYARLGPSGRAVPRAGPPSSAASPSARTDFPTLGNSSGASRSSAPKNIQRTTAWSAAGSGLNAPVVPPIQQLQQSGPSQPSRPYSVNVQDQSTANKNAGPTITKAAFPALSTSDSVVVPRAFIGGNQSLRNVGGGSSKLVANAWSSGGPKPSPASGGAHSSQQASTASIADGSSEKKKKGKGKEKLFTLGAHHG